MGIKHNKNFQRMQPLKPTHISLRLSCSCFIMILSV